MPTRVQVQGHGIVEFPDGMSADDMKAAIEKLAPSSEPTPQTWVDKAVDWLPAIGGGIGGMVGTAAGPLGSIGGATLGAGAGEAYKQLINRARGVSAPASPGEAATAIGKQGVVQGAVPAAAGEALGAGMRTAGPWLMQSAVKPTLAMLKRSGGSADRLVQTLLDEGIQVSPAGVQKLQVLLTATNDEISDAVAASPAQINAYKVASRLTDTAKKFAQQVNPDSDLEAIAKAGNEFLANHVTAASASMPVSQAQALKAGTYAQLANKYGELGSAATEAQKALARGLKEEIANEVPVVSALNQREGSLLQALDAVGRRAALSGNRDPIGFAWVTKNPTTFLASLLDRGPAVKSMLARGLYQSAGTAAQVAPQLIRAAVESIATAPSGASPAPASSSK